VAVFAGVKPLGLLVDCQTKIGHVGVAVRVQQHVGWFQIAMHQALSVRMLNRRRHLNHDLPDAIRREIV
jgi:hypothetical protein